MWASGLVYGRPPEVTGGSGGPPGFPALKDLWTPKGHVFLRGGQTEF